MDRVELFIRNNCGMTDQMAISRILKVAHVREISKGDFLVKQEEHPTGLFFLFKGLLRGYFLDAQGHEVTDCFGFHFGATAMPYADPAKPSPISIVAMEDSEILEIPIETIFELLNTNLQVVQIFSKMLLAGAEEHWEIKKALYRFTTSERYEWFLQRYEGLIDRVSHAYIASFLGMTPVSLSRLRRKYK